MVTSNPGAVPSVSLFPEKNAEAPVAAPPAAAPDPVPSPTPPTGKELHGWLVTAGLFNNIYTDDLLRRLSDLYDVQIRNLEAAQAVDLAHLEEQIAGAERQKEADRERIGHLREQEETLQESLTQAAEDVRRWSSTLRGKLQQLHARRADYPRQILEAKLQERASLRGAMAEQILAEERARLEVERAVQEIARERRGLNKEEYDRRVALITEQRDACRKRLDDHAGHVDRLRGTGITRKLSGFLCWAGYLAFIALGWYLGQAVDARHEPEPGFLEALFDFVVAGLPNFFRAVGPVGSLAFVVVAPLLVLGLGGALIFGTDRVLQLFDEHWKRGGVRSRRGREGDRGALGWMGEPDEPLTRSHYGQALSRLPLVYVWIVATLFVAWIFAVSGGVLTPGGAGQPSATTDSFVYTYFGVVVAVVVAAFLAAYVTAVVRPRHARLLAVAGDRPAPRELLKANLEIVLVLGFMLVGLPIADILHGLLNAPLPMDLWAVDRITAILILITANGLVVAYGMMYRGMFYDLDMLRRELSRYDRQLQRYTALPTAPDPDVEHSRFERELADLQSDIDAIWSGLEAEPQLAPGGTPFGFRWRRRRRPIPEPPVAEVDSEATSWYDWRDVRFAPGLVDEVQEVAPQLSTARVRHEQTEARLREVQDELQSLMRIDWVARFRQLRDKLEETRRSYQERIAAIRLRSVSELLQATNARLVGSLARSRNEGSPAHAEG